MRLARRWRFLLVLTLAAVAVYDVTRPPAMQVTSRVALIGIRTYQATLSPLLGRAGFACRFTPSCSRYAAVVIERHGLVRGGWQAARRIARCGPWTPVGTRDLPE
jgi:putative membrane protein insertion efficiency factor